MERITVVGGRDDQQTRLVNAIASQLELERPVPDYLAFQRYGHAVLGLLRRSPESDCDRWVCGLTVQPRTTVKRLVSNSNHVLILPNQTGFDPEDGWQSRGNLCELDDRQNIWNLAVSIAQQTHTPYRILEGEFHDWLSELSGDLVAPIESSPT